jgi:hypothetical protein
VSSFNVECILSPFTGCSHDAEAFAGLRVATWGWRPSQRSLDEGGEFVAVGAEHAGVQGRKEPLAARLVPMKAQTSMPDELGNHTRGVKGQ